jgi:hypothetical protein
MGSRISAGGDGFRKKGGGFQIAEKKAKIAPIISKSKSVPFFSLPSSIFPSLSRTQPFHEDIEPQMPLKP